MTPRNVSGRPRAIVITGCSSGFGQLTAARLSRHKNTLVFATMRDPSQGRELLPHLPADQGSLRIVGLDVSNPESIRQAVEAITAESRQIDVLINNAGIATVGFFETLSDAEIRDLFEVNFFGLQAVTRSFLPFFEENGLIINISSLSGLVGLPMFSAYAASKFALEGYSESLRLELGVLGIKVVLVEPGCFETPMFGDKARFAAAMDLPQQRSWPLAQHILQLFQGTLSRFRGDPERVAELIERIITKPRPRFRYMIGNDARLLSLARQFLPFSLYERLLRRLLLRPPGGRGPVTADPRARSE